MKTLSFLLNESTNPAYNLALEEVLCDSGREVFMLWRNEPSVILGRFNDVNQSVNLDSCSNINVNIVRRNSGGGAVYHDLGNVNYSFILNDSKKYSLSFFAGIVINILQEIGINSTREFTHNDILLNGSKISGTAQYHRNDIILHHGTLLFDSDLTMIPRLLKRSGKVTNIRPALQHDMNIHEFMRHLRDKINGEVMALSEKEIQRANELMQRKYLNPKWNMEGVYT
ncbi:MAG: lipoate--protein ligase family protein [Synergistaceae bacterium]|nr:lipoate--protein ligase family protein [Synergistaceae bacterium]